MNILIATLLLIPLAAIVLMLVLPDERPAPWLAMASASCVFLQSLLVIGWLRSNDNLSLMLLSRAFYVDHMSALYLFLVSSVDLVSTAGAIGWMKRESGREGFKPSRVRYFFVMKTLLSLTMLLLVSVQNIGLLWVAIEATTVASAFLVGWEHHRASVEAAWKYLMICSVGLAVALLGIILFYYAGIQGGGSQSEALNLTWLAGHAQQLPGGVLKLAFVFVLAGFGTKAGLVPMHTWLPDAYSQAPASVSAVLSGALSSCALYCVVRFQSVVNTGLGAGAFTQRLLLFFGIVSVLVAAMAMLNQKDARRQLAYSSIENIGFVAVGFGAGPVVGMIFAVYQSLMSGLAKSVAFLSLGEIENAYGTHQIPKVRGVLSGMPVIGGTLGISVFMLLGMPVSGIFWSKLGVLRQLFGANPIWMGVILLVCLVVVAAGFLGGSIRMLFGETAEVPSGKGARMTQITCVVVIALLVLTCSGLPQEVQRFLGEAASQALGGGL